MFTIKHITGEREAIYSGERVVFYSNSEEVAMSFSIKDIPLKEVVTILDGEGKALCDLCRGTVYVMNNHGSTVAKYDMSDLE
jgi:hypothetical protein